MCFIGLELMTGENTCEKLENRREFKGFVDELTVSLIAMVLSSGIPLFSVMNREHECHLITSQAYPSGLVQLKYKLLINMILEKRILRLVQPIKIDCFVLDQN